MKILWFTWKDLDNPLAGGAEVVNEELASRLAADGHQVVFITGSFAGAKFNLTRRGFRIIRVGSRYTSYPRALLEYHKHWDNWPDLVIDECNTMPYFASFYTRGRQVLFFHMLCRRIWFYEFPPGLNLIGYLAEPLYLRMLNRGQPVITVSESTKKDLMRHGYKSGQIHVISEGIEVEPVPDLDSISKFDHPTVLSVGAMRSMKRTLDQVKAFEIAKRKLPDLHLILAGDTSSKYGQKVCAYATSSPAHDSISILGRVPSAKKQTLMQQSHLLVSTAVKEGWGLTVTEAASQGTPSVTYNADGLKDSVANGTTGLLTPTNTPYALADTIVSLLQDESRYQKLQLEAWQHSQKNTFEQSYIDFKRALSI